MIDTKKLREGLGCLVPRPGVEMPSCHERTLCDCTVLELIDRLEAAERDRDAARKAGFMEAVGILEAAAFALDIGWPKSFGWRNWLERQREEMKK